jgi:hypothetical protein
LSATLSFAAPEPPLYRSEPVKLEPVVFSYEPPDTEKLVPLDVTVEPISHWFSQAL